MDDIILTADNENAYYGDDGHKEVSTVASFYLCPLSRNLQSRRFLLNFWAKESIA